MFKRLTKRNRLNLPHNLLTARKLSACISERVHKKFSTRQIKINKVLSSPKIRRCPLILLLKPDHVIDPMIDRAETGGRMDHLVIRSDHASV